ncbi:MAG: PD40 domain-containing protein [Burkholderiales bacterium]|nr:PD40 domain-containing protein [Bacteroidia bacterium]
MKPLCFKLILFTLFLIMGQWLLAQQKDSLPVKPIEIKEDVNVAKKRKFIYFVSNRLSDDDKYDVFKVTPSSQSPALIVIRGHMDVIGNPNEKKAKINVYNVSNNALVGTYNSNSYTGNYLLILAPNVKYLFKVEVSGYGTTEEIVEVPLKIDYEICQQDIKIKLNEKQKPVLMINSFFADENEKVFYLRSTIDTTKLNSENTALNDGVDKVDKNGKGYSNIDELVKKQLEEEKKKPEEALTAFKNNEFEKALGMYAGLLKNDLADPLMNYYYGICLVKLDKNKAKAINSLLIASAVKETPADVFYYLGRAYHLSYLFNDAIKAYEQFKGRVKPYDFEGLNGPLLIKNCMNGNNVMNDPINMEVVKRTPTQLENILANYNPDLINEKVRFKTDFFNSTIDKKKQTKFLMSNINPREYYHISYGEKEQTHTDLYKNTLLPNGILGPSQTLGPEINTPYDENYPYLTTDGNTLYFSSKGHNSIGGYDIFKCTRKDSLSAWSRPQNMGYPINSTYDDILFVPDESNQTASYCTNRKNSSYEYTQIKLPQHPVSNSIIKGCFNTLDSIPKKEAYITVYNSGTGEIAGVYKTNPLTGQYLMILLSGTKYDMSVESEGYSEQTSSFELPDKKGEYELKQTIKLQTTSGQKTIKVNNYFTEAEAAKISFDIIPPKKVNSLAGQEIKKPLKLKKPKRTVEEAEKDKEDLKLAETLYDQTVYQEAALIYQTLDHYIDLSPMDAYRYGICLFHTKKDKTNCINALEAASALKPVPIEIYYYLAKSNHMSYRFSTAINYYKKYMSLCKPEDIKSLKIEQEIIYCNNGIKLVNNPVVLEVYGKKHVDQNAIQNSLMQIESGGKVLVITDDMRSSIDKKKDFKSLLYLTPDKNTVLYSSYGEDEKNGKDIYQLKKLANGKWSPLPQNITAVNSPLDEEYPSLSKDGKILYFSSKGFENMGEYDIFKSEWNESTQSWLAPVNLGSPVNSPFDDIYFLE